MGVRRRSKGRGMRRLRGLAGALLGVPALQCLVLPASAQGGAPRDTSPLWTEVSFAQFVQGPVAGGIDTEAAYGGKVDVTLKVDTRRLGIWNNGTLEAKLATRYGDVTDETGAIIPVNTALIDPATEGTATALIALNYTHLVPLGKRGDALVLGIGRFSILEQIPDGSGVTGFMNVAQIAPSTEARNIPLVTNGASLAVVRKGEPVFAFLAIDPRSLSMTSGLSDPFEDGVTLSPSVIVPTRFFGKHGHQGLRGTWSTRELTPFDEIRHLFLPRPDGPVTVRRESGGWSLTYTGDQYVRETGPHAGWRLYWNLGIADETTNPIDRFFNVGVGGTSPIGGRAMDTFGVAWAYTGFGDDFTDLLAPLVELDAEQSIEGWYNLGLAPWLRLTADVQVILPGRPGIDTAVVPALRLQIVR